MTKIQFQHPDLISNKSSALLKAFVLNHLPLMDSAYVFNKV